jgi:hypothetical protein
LPGHGVNIYLSHTTSVSEPTLGLLDIRWIGAANMDFGLITEQILRLDLLQLLQRSQRCGKRIALPSRDISIVG